MPKNLERKHQTQKNNRQQVEARKTTTTHDRSDRADVRKTLARLSRMTIAVTRLGFWYIPTMVIVFENNI